MNKVYKYLGSVAISVSQMANAVILFGDPDETISGRSYRRGVLDGNIVWKGLSIVINCIFFLQEDHVKESYVFDIKRARRVVIAHDSRP